MGFCIVELQFSVRCRCVRVCGIDAFVTSMWNYMSAFCVVLQLVDFDVVWNIWMYQLSYVQCVVCCMNCGHLGPVAPTTIKLEPSSNSTLTLVQSQFSEHKRGSVLCVEISSTLNHHLSSDQILIQYQLCSCMHTSQKIVGYTRIVNS